MSSVTTVRLLTNQCQLKHVYLHGAAMAPLFLILKPVEVHETVHTDNQR